MHAAIFLIQDIQFSILLTYDIQNKNKDLLENCGI